MSQPAMHQPMDPVGFCAPHLVLGVNVHATTTVGGTAMCTEHAVANMTAASSSTSTGGTSTGGTGLVIRLG